MNREKCNICYFSSGSKELAKISGLKVQNKKAFGVYISKEAEFTTSFYKLFFKIGQCNYLMGCSTNTLELFQLAK